jgi:hypothetical protein
VLPAVAERDHAADSDAGNGEYRRRGGPDPYATGVPRRGGAEQQPVHVEVLALAVVQRRAKLVFGGTHPITLL